MQKKMISKLGGGKTILLIAVMSALFVFCMAVIAFGAPYQWNPPTQPMTVDRNVITISSKGAAETMPEFLGANLVTARPLVTDAPAEALGVAIEKAFLGTYGTSVNANPNPYVWNYFYNIYARANNLPVSEDVVRDSLQGSPAMADTTIVPEYGTSLSLHLRPDILLGTDAAAGNTYVELIADLPENKDADTANNYSPTLIAYKMRGIGDMIETMHATAAEMNKISAATGKSTRYGDPTVIAVDYENFVRGIQFYVLSELEKNNIAKKTVAVVNPTDLGDGTFTVYSTATSSGTAAINRGSEYLELTTVNLIDKLNLQPESPGVYKATAAQLLEADSIYIASTNVAAMNRDVFVSMLADKYNVDAQRLRSIPIHDTDPGVIFSIVANSCENALGFGIYQGFAYGADLDFNPIYAAAYFYEKFYHLTDATALANAIAVNFQDVSLPQGTTTSLSGYSAADFEAKLLQGMDYYEDHAAEYEGTRSDWNIDRTKGIGLRSNPVNPAALTDIAGHWARNDIAALVNRGLFTGATATTFEPATDMTRAMVVTVLYRYDGQKEPTVNKFTDIRNGTYYSNAAIWASNQAISAGESATVFGPNTMVTREELASMLYNFARYKGVSVTNTGSLTAYTDASTIAAGYQDAVKWAIANGIIEGTTPTTVAPKQTASRAEVVAMLSRFINLLEK